MFCSWVFNVFSLSLSRTFFSLFCCHIFSTKKVEISYTAHAGGISRAARWKLGMRSEKIYKFLLSLCTHQSSGGSEQCNNKRASPTASSAAMWYIIHRERERENARMLMVEIQLHAATSLTSPLCARPHTSVFECAHEFMHANNLVLCWKLRIIKQIEATLCFLPFNGVGHLTGSESILNML